MRTQETLMILDKALLLIPLYWLVPFPIVKNDEVDLS